MPRRIALIVGVSKYEPRTGLHNLSAPANDAQRVYEVLAEYGGFDELYPLPLANGKVDGSGWVKAQELRAKLHEVLNPQLADEVELAVFYFSGHGVNPDGQVAYLSTSDKPLAVAISHIAKLAKYSAVKNICIWLDCCHSGEMLEFSDLIDKGFCVVAASHADGEALALDGRSLLTELLCKALTPSEDCQEIQVKHFINELEQQRHNLPQQILCRWSDAPFTLTQINGEVVRESSSLRNPARGWIWHSTDESIAAGQISVLSVLETFCALGLYSWLAFHFEHQWWLLISAVAAPLFLFRSDESTHLTIKLLTNSINTQEELFIEKIATTISRVVVISLILIPIIFFFKNLSTILQHIFYQDIFIGLALGGGIAIIIIYILHLDKLIDIRDIIKLPLIFFTFWVLGMVFGIISASFIGCLFYFFGITQAISVSIGIGASLNILAIHILIITFYEISRLIYIILIRLISTLYNIYFGLFSLQGNYKEILFLIDTFYPIKFILANKQYPHDDLNIKIEKHDERTHFKIEYFLYEVIIKTLRLGIYYPMTIVGRWSLKSTFWLWWILVLLMKPPFLKKNIMQIRDIYALRIYGLGKWLPLLAVVVMLWLGLGYLSPEDLKSWAGLGGDTISKLLNKLLAIAPPPPGLRHWALWLVCGLSIIMWWLSDRLQIMHKEVLEKESTLDGLTKERRNLFLQRAHRLERWHMARVVSFILLGYSFALYLANEWYPLELGRFVPAWLIGWL